MLNGEIGIVISWMTTLLVMLSFADIDQKRQQQMAPCGVIIK